MRTLALLLLAACSGSPPGITHAERVEAEDFFAPPPVPIRTLAVALAPDRDAGDRIVLPPTPPTWTGGMRPIVLEPERRPVAGQPYIVEWQLECARAAVMPVRKVSVLASTRPLDAPYALAGGNWLLTHPDFVMVPVSAVSEPNAPFTYKPNPGIVRLAIVPDAALSGTTFYLQLLVEVPEAAPLGHLLSPLLVVEVGSR